MWLKLSRGWPMFLCSFEMFLYNGTSSNAALIVFSLVYVQFLWKHPSACTLWTSLMVSTDSLSSLSSNATVSPYVISQTHILSASANCPFWCTYPILNPFAESLKPAGNIWEGTKTLSVSPTDIKVVSGTVITGRCKPSIEHTFCSPLIHSPPAALHHMPGARLVSSVNVFINPFASSYMREQTVLTKSKGNLFWNVCAISER